MRERGDPLGRREILIPEKQYDPFTNPNPETLLDALDPDESPVAVCLAAWRRAAGVRFTAAEDAASSPG